MHRYLAIILLILSIIAFSCKKPEPEVNIDDAIQLAEDESLAEWMYMDIIRTSYAVHSMVHDSIFNNQSTLQDTSTTDTTEIHPPELYQGPPIYIDNKDTITWPKHITIDYGEGMTEIRNGNTFKGKINIEISGEYTKKDNSIKIDLENYFFNGISVKGNITMDKIVQQDSARTVYSNIVLQNGELKAYDKNLMKDSLIITRGFNRKYYWKSGTDTTADLLDDYFTITGTTNGSYSGLGDYDVEIVDPLHYSFSCGYISKGIYEITYDEYPLIKLDYGIGKCENIGKVTKEGTTQDFLTRFRFYRQ